MDSELVNWPEDPIKRIEAKVDNLRDNHLHTLDGRIDDVDGRLFAIEQKIIEKDKWSFRMGLATLILVLYMIL